MPATQQTLDKMDRFMSDSQSEALVRAIRCGDLEGVRHALEAGADPDYRDQYGDPGLPLRIASFKGFNGIIRELLDHGAAINPAPNPPQECPIALAARGAQTDTVRLLLEMGAWVPPGLQTGLSLPELLKAQGFPPPPARASADRAPGSLAGLDWSSLEGAYIEEINLTDCFDGDEGLASEPRPGPANSHGPAARPPARRQEPAGKALEKFWFWRRRG